MDARGGNASRLVGEMMPLRNTYGDFSTSGLFVLLSWHQAVVALPSIFDSQREGRKWIPVPNTGLGDSGRTPLAVSVPLATQERQDPDAPVKGGEI